MSLLLDTHALVWLVVAPQRLSAGATAAMTEDGVEVHASHVSIWEIAIKRGLGRMPDVDRQADEWFDHYVRASGVRQLAIAPQHLGGIESLPLHHRDPFDRLLVSQALLEDLTIVTADDIIDRYGVATLW